MKEKFPFPKQPASKFGLGTRCRECGHDPVYVLDQDLGGRIKEHPKGLYCYSTGRETYKIECPKCKARYSLIRSALYTHPPVIIGKSQSTKDRK